MLTQKVSNPEEKKHSDYIKTKCDKIKTKAKEIMGTYLYGSVYDFLKDNRKKGTTDDAILEGIKKIVGENQVLNK